MRVACDADRRSGAQTRHDVVGDLEIGEDILHVVAILESLEQLEERLGDIALDTDRGLWSPNQARRFRRTETLLERVTDAVQLIGRAGHDMLGGAQPRIGRRIGQTGARRGRQFTNDLGKDLGALLILRALAVHDVLELGMASHGRYSRSYRVARRAAPGGIAAIIPRLR